MHSCTRHTTRPRRAACVALTRALTRAHAAAQALVKVAGAIGDDRVRACTRRPHACVRALWRREGGGVLTGRAGGVATCRLTLSCRAQTYFGKNAEDTARWLDENEQNREELMKLAMVRHRRAATRARRPCRAPVADARVTARQRAFNGNSITTPIFAEAFDAKVAVAPHPRR